MAERWEDRQEWIERALSIGFTAASPLAVESLNPMKEIREMCASDRCRAYGKNWTCPPACGTLEECERRLKNYTSGIILQTVGKMSKDIDTRAYRETEQDHLRYFHEFCAQLRQKYPHALCLGSGGCRICKTCAYPEPCRFPEKALSSMEAYGLFVTQVCRDSGVQDYYGPRTITYTACVLV